MGLAVPRPAMRAAEARRIEARLKRHAELTACYVAQGMTKEAASEKAFNIVTGREVESEA